MGTFAQLAVESRASARLYVAGIDEAGAAPARPGVLVLHPWWGLNQDVLDYADRLAAEGFAVAAPDLFGGRVETTIEGAEQAADSAERAVVSGIVLAATDLLAGRLGAAPLAVLGFSFGAAWGVWAPTRRPNLAATIVYYGTWTGPVVAGSRVPL